MIPDDFDLDAEILAERVGGSRWLDRRQLAEALEISEGSVWTWVRRGKIPAPSRFVGIRANRSQALWSIDELAEAMRKRPEPKPVVLEWWRPHPRV